MGYHLTWQPRSARPPISPEAVCRRLNEALGLTGTFVPAERTLKISSSSGEKLLNIFLSPDKTWWSQHLDDAQLDVFVQLAEAFDCDVQGDAGEIFRCVDGKAVALNEAGSAPTAPAGNEADPSFGFLILIVLGFIAYAGRYFLL
jgi:hypothetical protein